MNRRPLQSFALTVSLCVIGVFPGTSSLAREIDQIRVEEIATPIDSSCRGIAAVSANEVWVTGAKGTVIRTVNAGKKWKLIEVPGAEKLDFRDIAALPEGTVILMSAGSGATSRVYRSTDHGESWQLVLQNDDEKGFFNGLEFDSTNRIGMLVGDPVDGHLDMYWTGDAGKSWQRFPKNERPELNEGEYGFAASGTGLAYTTSYMWVATGGSQASVWRRLRSAGWWDRLPTPIRAGDSSAGIFSISMTDDDHGVIIGGDYKKPELDSSNVAFTSDRGRTWQINAGQKMPHKACVRSLGDGSFLTVGRTGIAYSGDGGNTWRHVSDDSYYTLSVSPNKKHAWAAGTDGRVARITIAEGRKLLQ